MKTLRSFEMPGDKRKDDFFAELFGGAAKEAGNRRADGGLATADFIRVPSIEDSIEQIEKLGGHVVVPKKAVPGSGYFAVCLDTENRAFGLWQDERKPA